MNYTTKVLRIAAVLIAAVYVTACATTEAVVVNDVPDASSVMSAPAPAENYGSIYMAGRNMALFTDQRARQIGDSITVTLVEQTDASKSSSTATAKGTSVGIAAPTLFGRPLTYNGDGFGNSSVSADTDFSGSGSSSQSNSLTGSITVVVREVMPNGLLRVEGDKWLTINQGKEFIHVKGYVRPIDIGADNSIPSFKLADARITYSGKGVIADANRPGWISRFFNSVLSPF